MRAWGVGYNKTLTLKTIDLGLNPEAQSQLLGTGSRQKVIKCLLDPAPVSGRLSEGWKEPSMD